MTATRPIAGMPRRLERPRSGWLAITGLLLLSALPVVGGLLRLGEVSADPDGVAPWALPIAAVAHILSMSVFCLLGAFQFSPALRVRHRWHRTVGRVLLPAGFVAALSSMPIGVFFDGPSDEYPLAIVRVVFATVMTFHLVRAAAAITRRDFARHGAWMTRAYAIAISGGTQAIVSILWAAVAGDVDVVAETWLVALGFLINSVVAEWLIRRRTNLSQKVVTE